MASLSALKTLYQRASLRLHGNTISWKTNTLYSLYNALIKARFAMRTKRYPPDIEQLAYAIRTTGMAQMEPVLQPSHQQALSRKVARLLSENEKVVSSLKDSGLIRLKGSLLEVPELEQVLMHPRIIAVIEYYFGSYFKVFACDVYRTFPENAEAAAQKFSSLRWHFDNCPASLLKVMIYLTDTARETGAISLVPKEVSLQLKREGFWNRTQANQFEDKINRNTVYLEGRAGTVLFFSTHYCIHRATLPVTGYRDVAVFLVQPSLVPQRPFSPESRTTYSYNFGYCINPFSDRPLRYGDE